MSEKYRLERIKRMIQSEISFMILHEVIKDPRVGPLISISDISVGRDLSQARIWVSSIESPKKLMSAVTALNHAAGFIQKTIGKKIYIRAVPKLIFLPDTSIQHGFDILKKIEDITH